MPYYKRKPLIEEAIQYEKGKAYLIEAFIGTELYRDDFGTMIYGEHSLSPGDWAIKLHDGKIIAMSDEEFQVMYEETRKKPAAIRA